MLGKLKNETPNTYQEFYEWYYKDFAQVCFNAVEVIEMCPMDFLIDIFQIFIEERKGLKVSKPTPETIYHIFKTVE